MKSASARIPTPWQMRTRSISPRLKVAMPVRGSAPQSGQRGASVVTRLPQRAHVDELHLRTSFAARRPCAVDSSRR